MHFRGRIRRKSADLGRTFRASSENPGTLRQKSSETSWGPCAVKSLLSIWLAIFLSYLNIRTKSHQLCVTTKLDKGHGCCEVFEGVKRSKIFISFLLLLFRPVVIDIHNAGVWSASYELSISTDAQTRGTNTTVVEETVRFIWAFDVPSVDGTIF